jgi:hypothetical protein
MNNIYHRYLKLPFEYSKPIFFNHSYTHANMICISSKSIDNSVIKWLKSFNLKVSNVIERFYTPANGGKFPMHNDTPNISNAVKINFTWGPENSVTRWWKTKEESFLIPIKPDNSQIKSLGITPDIEINSAFSAKEENCDLVYEKIINKPSLMNIGQLHSTFNPHTTEDRWTLCFILLKMNGEHLQFEEALKIFKDIVYE